MKHQSIFEETKKALDEQCELFIKSNAPQDVLKISGNIEALSEILYHWYKLCRNNAREHTDVIPATDRAFEQQY